METLTYHMRCTVIGIARSDKQKAKVRIKSFLQMAYHTLQRDELEEFLRDVAVLKNDVEEL